MRTAYHDFLDLARGEYDLDYGEAQELYREYRGELGVTGEDAFALLLDVVTEGELELEEGPEVEPEREPGMYFGEEVDAGFEYDYDDIADYWLFEGEEVEIVVYYQEDT